MFTKSLTQPDSDRNAESDDIFHWLFEKSDAKPAIRAPTEDDDRRQKIELEMSCCGCCHVCTKKDGSLGLYRQYCRHWKGEFGQFCPTCVRYRAIEHRGWVRRAVQVAKKTGHAIFTVEVMIEQQEKMRRRYKAANMLSCPLQNGQVRVFWQTTHDDNRHVGLLLDESNIDAIDWEETAKTPKGCNRSGKLGQIGLEAECQNEDDASREEEHQRADEAHGAKSQEEWDEGQDGEDQEQRDEGHRNEEQTEQEDEVDEADGYEEEDAGDDYETNGEHEGVSDTTERVQLTTIKRRTVVMSGVTMAKHEQASRVAILSTYELDPHTPEELEKAAEARITAYIAAAEELGCHVVLSYWKKITIPSNSVNGWDNQLLLCQDYRAAPDTPLSDQRAPF